MAARRIVVALALGALASMCPGCKKKKDKEAEGTQAGGTQPNPSPSSGSAKPNSSQNGSTKESTSGCPSAPHIKFSLIRWDAAKKKLGYKEMSWSRIKNEVMNLDPKVRCMIDVFYATSSGWERAIKNVSECHLNMTVEEAVLIEAVANGSGPVTRGKWKHCGPQYFSSDRVLKSPKFKIHVSPVWGG